MVDELGGPRWRLIEYKDLPNSFITRRTNTWGGGSNPDTVAFAQSSCPGRKAITYTFGFEDWARFLGWYVSEGWTSVSTNSNSYRIGIAQMQGDKYEEIAALLTRMGITFSRLRHQLRFSHYTMGEWLREHCGVGSGNKRVLPALRKPYPRALRRSSTRSARATAPSTPTRTAAAM
ncbi:hypothetical protein Hesp01_14990 [Herbidospora sp. NBRC 101105]|nr:hypothetical protein Hesp01_14990 [Herbidospora sp. NBRC 101105]